MYNSLLLDIHEIIYQGRSNDYLCEEVEYHNLILVLYRAYEYRILSFKY